MESTFWVALLGCRSCPAQLGVECSLWHPKHIPRLSFHLWNCYPTVAVQSQQAPQHSRALSSGVDDCMETGMKGAGSQLEECGSVFEPLWNELVSPHSQFISTHRFFITVISSIAMFRIVQIFIRVIKDYDAIKTKRTLVLIEQMKRPISSGKLWV